MKTKKESAWKQKCLEARAKIAEVRSQVDVALEYMHSAYAYRMQAKRDIESQNFGLAKAELQYHDNALESARATIILMKGLIDNKVAKAETGDSVTKGEPTTKEGEK